MGTRSIPAIDGLYITDSLQPEHRTHEGLFRRRFESVKT